MEMCNSRGKYNRNQHFRVAHRPFAKVDRPSGATEAHETKLRTVTASKGSQAARTSFTVVAQHPAYFTAPGGPSFGGSLEDTDMWAKSRYVVWQQ